MREHIKKDKEFLECITKESISKKCITKEKHFQKMPTKESISKKPQ